jgi:hypothetical protein
MDVEDALTSLVAGAIRSRLQTKNYSVKEHNIVTRIEFFSGPGPEAKTKG